MSGSAPRELIRRLDAQILTPEPNLESLIENFTVGAMTLDAALSHFRRQPHKAVITGGDRTDIQLAALETSSVALILTGNLVPSPLVVRQAEAVGVPILLVKENTIETVNRIEQAYGKTRLGESEKLATFMELMEKHVDIAWLYASLGLT